MHHTSIEAKKAELVKELEQVVKEHNEALELKNAKYKRYTEIQASLKTLAELSSEAEQEETTTAEATVVE